MTVVCPHAPGLLRRDTIDGVEIIRFPYPFSNSKPIVYTGNMHQEVAGSLFAKLVFAAFLRSFYKAALRVVREQGADVLWANWWIPPGIIAAKIASKLNIPLVISSHGTDIALLKKGGILTRLSSFTYSRTTRASVVSEFLRDTLTGQVKDISPEHIAVVPMPVGMETFPKTAAPENDIPVILSVARYTRQKHLDDLILAVKNVIDRGHPCALRLVGEGPLEHELKALVAENKLEAYVTFTPLVAQQRLAELYRESDIIALVSENEGFGLVLIEAGLTGRPVVGARSGGIPDIIVDGKNGLLVEVGDIDSLAAAFESLIQDKDKRMALGEGGYRRAMDHFSTQVLVDKIHNLFSAALSGA